MARASLLNLMLLLMISLVDVKEAQCAIATNLDQPEINFLHSAQIFPLQLAHDEEIIVYLSKTIQNTKFIFGSFTVTVTTNGGFDFTIGNTKSNAFERSWMVKCPFYRISESLTPRSNSK